MRAVEDAAVTVKSVELIFLKWVFPETHTSGFRKEHAHDISGFSRKKVAETVQRSKKRARGALSLNINPKGQRSASRTHKEILYNF